MSFRRAACCEDHLCAGPRATAPFAASCAQASRFPAASPGSRRFTSQRFGDPVPPRPSNRNQEPLQRACSILEPAATGHGGGIRRNRGPARIGTRPQSGPEDHRPRVPEIQTVGDRQPATAAPQNTLGPGPDPCAARQMGPPVDLDVLHQTDQPIRTADRTRRTDRRPPAHWYPTDHPCLMQKRRVNRGRQAVAMTSPAY